LSNIQFPKELRTPPQACYIDAQATVSWWHRNLARTQYGLQGWKRHKVYPDFVFAQVNATGPSRLVVLETKGMHLAGSDDSTYKQELLEGLSRAFADESLDRLGELELVGPHQSVVCDLLFDRAWRGRLDSRYFGAGSIRS
jgi:type III restriction enzyme